MLRLFVGLKRIIEGSVCNNIIGRRRLIKSTYVIKNRFYQGNFFLRSYCRYIKIRSDGKILLEKLAKNGRCKFALSIAHLRLTSWLKFSFQIFSILVFFKKAKYFFISNVYSRSMKFPNCSGYRTRKITDQR